MSLENQRQRRKFMGLLGASALAGLTGCGGGGSAASGPLRQALSAPPQVTREDAPRRRDQVYQRQGITAIVTSADGTAVGVAHTDGRVLLLDGQGHETLTLQPTGISNDLVRMCFSVCATRIAAISSMNWHRSWTGRMAN